MKEVPSFRTAETYFGLHRAAISGDLLYRDDRSWRNVRPDCAILSGSGLHCTRQECPGPSGPAHWPPGLRPGKLPPQERRYRDMGGVVSVLPLTRCINGKEQIFTHLEVQCILTKALKKSLQARFNFREMPYVCDNLVWGM